MSIRNLDRLFAPKAVAVIGATNRERSVGLAVMRNLLQAGFSGPVLPVNPKHEAVAGVLCYPDVARLPVTPDLAVICTPAPIVPGLIEALGERGTKAAVVLTAGLGRDRVEDGRTLQQAMLDAARPHLLRIVGPNCLGVLAPGAGLNASFAHVNPLPGRVALVHQSGALCTALLDWARSNRIGFSHFVSVGDSADVDFGDLLDYLGGEVSAHAILLYVEAIRDARKFMSAARAAARNKPVLVIKAGRAAEGARAAASHTGALAGADDVYDAAIRRAGMLRVYETGEMFDAVETLANARTASLGERLAILTNGGGPGVIATDALVLAGGHLAAFGPGTVERLNAVLPATWSPGNPVDIIGDAGRERYAAALRILVEDEGVDTVLVLHAPTAVVSSTAAAEGVVEVAKAAGRDAGVMACWLGGDTVKPARRLLTEAGIANYDTPEDAVRAFMHIVAYRRNQALLMETPDSIPDAFEPATESARLVIENALVDSREVLTETEAKAVLAAYGIPVVETRVARTPEQAAEIAADIGFPVALKVLSNEISHKSDVGGVVLNLPGAGETERAARAMAERVATLRPDARLTGFTVQRMARRPGAHELIVGAVTDAVFGPVVLFGEGGTAVEVIADKAVSLAPLNQKLAAELIARTRVSRLLAGYRDRAAADLAAIRRTLLQVSQLVTDLAAVVELDINPLLADERGVLALDARVRVAATRLRGAERLAIRPYPKALEESLALDGLDLFVRPIRPEDEAAHQRFLEALDPQDIRFRFFGMVRHFAHTQLARFTQIDYDREMAFLATRREAGVTETIGVVRAVCDPDNVDAEFAIVISSRLKGRHLGRALLEKMIRYCRARGTRWMVGQVLEENAAMLGLARSLGFEIRPSDEPGVMSVRLALDGAPALSRPRPAG